MGPKPTTSCPIFLVCFYLIIRPAPGISKHTLEKASWFFFFLAGQENVMRRKIREEEMKCEFVFSFMMWDSRSSVGQRVQEQQGPTASGNRLLERRDLCVTINSENETCITYELAWTCVEISFYLLDRRVLDLENLALRPF